MFIVLNHKEGSYLVYTLMSILTRCLVKMCQMCLSYDKNKALRVVPNSKICKVVHGTKCQIEFGRKTETCQIDLGPKIVKLIWAQ